MSQRTYHGEIVPRDMAAALIAAFNQGNFRCQQVGQGDKIMVQIATREFAHSGGKAALSVTIHKVTDGVTVGMGQHEWLGVAASLGASALAAFRNPWSIISRLDDIAQDINSLNLEQKAWEAIEAFARTAHATKEISQRLSTVMCEHCLTANKVGESNCVGCGAPLGPVQPVACRQCGNVMPPKSRFCSNCGAAMAG